MFRLSLPGFISLLLCCCPELLHFLGFLGCCFLCSNACFLCSKCLLPPRLRILESLEILPLFLFICSLLRLLLGYQRYVVS